MRQFLILFYYSAHSLILFLNTSGLELEQKASLKTCQRNRITQK
jgi:hypothetical protein